MDQLLKHNYTKSIPIRIYANLFYFFLHKIVVKNYPTVSLKVIKFFNRTIKIFNKTYCILSFNEAV